MSTVPRIDELRIKFDENPRRYFAPLANELRKAGELDQAIALCREHLPKQPGHMSGHIVFGQALFERGDLSEAQAVFEQALSLDPENLIALRHLGDIAQRMGESSAARRWYERVLEADPRNDDIAAQLSTLSRATPSAVRAVTPSSVSASTSAAAPVMPYTPTPIDVPELDAAASVIPTPAYPTPVVPAPAYPTPAYSTPAYSTPIAPASAFLTPVVPTAAVPTPAVPTPAVPTPVQTTSVPESLAPAPIESDPVAAEPEIPANTDPFFGEVVTDSDVEAASVVDDLDDRVVVEEVFEEGFVAAEWPDTSELAARVATPRNLLRQPTPPSVELPLEAVSAFGREPGDRVVGGLPEPELEVVETVLPPLEPSTEPLPDVTGGLDIRVGSSLIDFEEPESVAQPLEEADAPWMSTSESTMALFADDPEEIPEPMPEEAPAEAVVETAMESSVAFVDEPAAETSLPWLAEPVVPDGEVSEIAEAFAEDARARGEADDVAVVAMPEPTPARGVVAVNESSFADVLDDEASAPVEPGAGAFVTETMGELLVSQGFLDRAISVYEELVRRRPDDPVPAARLAELRDQATVTATPAAGTPSLPTPAVSTRTARELFAALAARRVERRTPPQAVAAVVDVASVVATPAYSPAVVVEQDHGSLTALFGTDTDAHDDQAAQVLAAAFSGATVEPGSDDFFGSGAIAAVREPTPVRPAVAQATPVRPTGAQPAGGFAFDRFFPDPATGRPSSGPSTVSPTSTPTEDSKAADDLAQFSVWLKGLGNS